MSQTSPMSPMVEELEGRLLMAGLAGQFTSVQLPSLLLPGSQVRAAVQVENSGALLARGNLSVKLYVSVDASFGPDDILLGELDKQTALAQNARKKLSAAMKIPAELPPGAYNLLAVIDHSTLVRGAATALASVKLNVVAPEVDLTGTFTAVGLGQTLIPGLTGTAAIKLNNAGNVRSAGQATVQFYASTDDQFGREDFLLGSVTKSLSVLPGKSVPLKANLSVPWDLPAGMYKILAVVNDDDHVYEPNHANNVLVANQDIGASIGADLVGQQMLIYSPAERGYPIGVMLMLANQGNQDAGGLLQVDFWASTDDTLSGDDLLLGTFNIYLYDLPGWSQESKPLLPGEARSYMINVPLPADMPLATYKLIASIDPDNHIKEIDENNNQLLASYPFTVIAP